LKAPLRLIKNIFSLSAAEVANKGIALITFGYLARVIDVNGFGIIADANSFIVYFLFMVNLGFTPVGSREIAKFQNKIRDIVNTIISIKLTIAIISYTALVLIVCFVLHKPADVKIIFLITGIQLFTFAFYTDYVFLGIEKMEIMAIRQLIIGLLNLAGVIILVHHRGDTILAVIVIVGTPLLNTIWMLWYYMKLYGKFKFEIDWKKWKPFIISSLPIAFSFFFIVVYLNFNINYLSAVRNYTETGLFNSSFKIFLMVLLPAGILQNAFYPILARADSIIEKKRISQKYASIMFFTGVFSSLTIFTFADYIVRFVWGTSFIESIPYLRILMITCSIAYIGMTYNGSLVAWKMEKISMIPMGVAFIVNIGLNLLLVKQYGAIATSWITVCTEICTTGGLTIIFFKTIRITYFSILIKIILFGIISGLTGYYVSQFGLHQIMSEFISLIIFTSLNFLFKTFSFTEIKGYFAK